MIVPVSAGGRRVVLAGAVRLLDLGFLRVGGEAYADKHSTYGLAILRKDHVTIDGEAAGTSSSRTRTRAVGGATSGAATDPKCGLATQGAVEQPVARMLTRALGATGAKAS